MKGLKPPVCRSETVEILGSISFICSSALKFCFQQLVVHSLILLMGCIYRCIFTTTVYFAVSRLFFLQRLHFELSAVQSVSILKFSLNLPPISATINHSLSSLVADTEALIAAVQTTLQAQGFENRLSERFGRFL